MSAGGLIRIYLDANAFIGSTEGSSDALVFLVGQASAGLAKLFTSELTLAEVLVHPLKHNQRDLIEIYEEMIVSDDTLSVVPVSRDVLRRSAEIRAVIGNKGGDAIHVATAALSACEYFVSSDKRIQLPSGIRRVEADLVKGMNERP